MDGSRSNGVIGEQIAQILDDYEKEVQKKAGEAIKSVSQDVVKRLRETSPKGKKGAHAGDYAKGWRVKKNKYDDYIVHNATDYQLTHLLEYGHALPQGGRARAFPHIAPAEKWAEGELIARIERTLNNG